MIDELKSIAILNYVVKFGSFRKTAEYLGYAPSVVSYHIRLLEERLGHPLLYRSTRKLSLTKEGEIFYAYAEKMVDSAQMAIDCVTKQSTNPIGKLTIAVPAILIYSHYMEKIAEFCRLYPGIELDLSFSDKRVSVIGDSFDVALRIGRLEDSNLKSKKLGVIERVLVISKKAFNKARLPMPKHVNDLKTFKWIGLKMLPNFRMIKDASGKKHKLVIEKFIQVDSVEAMTKLCELGLGIATPPKFLVKDQIKKNKLVELLPSHTVEGIDIFIVRPYNYSKNSLADLFIKHFSNNLSTLS